MLASGQVIHNALDVSNDHIYAILLRSLDHEAIVAVNTADTPINLTIEAPDGKPFVELILEVPAWRSQGEATTSGRSVVAELTGAGVLIFLREI